MFRALLPRDTSFFDFFEKHAALTVEGAKEFLALAGDTRDLASRARRIKEIEHETDVITHHCVEALHKTFITPIERDDIHRLISSMDDILDDIEAAAERLWLYEITTPLKEARDLARILRLSTEQLQIAVNGIRNLKRDAPKILAACVEINRLENEGDAILRQALAKLFREQKDALLVIKWKEIYENLENGTDRCEDVANIIEGVILEHA